MNGKKLHGILALFAVLMMQFSFAQEKTVSGKVTDDNGFPLLGVNVIEKGTNNGTQTDFDGEFSLSVEPGDVLVFSYVGFIAREVQVGADDVYNVALDTDTGSLEEVVVVAYGTTTKEAFTGSAEVIKSEQMEQRSLTSPISAIEGNATGVQITTSSGQPGSSPGIVIRGVGTLNGSTDPLYIVDGVQFEGDLNAINQNDIESITVLKDAASTSLYGSRAANGVVLITTKDGKKAGGLRVDVNSQYGVIDKAIDEYDFVGPGQYYELMWEGYKNSLDVDNPAAEASATIYNRLGYNPFDVPNDQIVGTDGQLNPNANVIFQGLDWYDALERQGSRESHNLSVSGGGDNHTVFFSASNLHERGYVVESSFRRTTSRLNANFTPTDWLTLGGNLNLSLSNTTGPSSRGTSIANPFSFAKDMGSIYPVYVVDPATGEYVRDVEGNLQYDRGEGYPDLGIRSRPNNVGRHAIEEAILNSDVTKTNNYGFRYNAGFKIIDGLELTLRYGQDVNDYLNKEYENNLVGDGAPAGRYSELRYRRTVENFNQIITYAKSFGNHNFDLTLGHESFDRHYSEVDGFKNTQTAVGIYEFDNFSTIADLSGYSSNKTLEGYFSRLNYNFDEKYYLSASARRDGSSVFNEDVRWGNFYSVGGAWRIDQEAFMDNVDFVNNLKLRASYGEVGNDDLNDYFISQPRYSLFPNAGEPGIFWSDLGNEELTWETVESWDVALEFGFFDYRLSGSIEFYRRNSTDLLYNVPLPISMGLSEGPANIGDMYNQGWELGLEGLIVDTEDFSWELGLQASTLKNEITFLPDPFVDGSKRWIEGRSRYDYFIHHYAGVDPENGDALYYAYEEDETGENVPVLNDDGTHQTVNDQNDANRAYVDATSIPDLIGSIRNDFTYKNFNLNFLFTYQLGGEILDYGYANMMHEGSYGDSFHPDILNAWKNPGDITDVPRLETGNNTLAPTLSSRWLTDASFLSLRNVNLSYDLGESALDQIGMDRLRLFVSAENLFILTERTGLDPQYNLSGTPSGNDYNPNRVISVGVNVAF
ncbi:SusC/RagA family TonB-linked outer membrane protein [Salegentibacter salinarum]|uniref:SusC/RagA family TonB-linked outer membrane protein n=1 Tax=Salegentibacter salinarum TaxID=447422 RepID=A0A2N0TW88_9FLAO|nr:TonB-dependent receptor [Salegentibacter salinarum]PKD19000.1 SusC/RagA family TonB-linked outer membrane protein [Salegentibacter salinarum]SKB96216.1 TonB-linked outer membrane protein, SusC/RagA family [Salegentibacter salinarum]